MEVSNIAFKGIDVGDKTEVEENAIYQLTRYSELDDMNMSTEAGSSEFLKHSFLR